MTSNIRTSCPVCQSGAPFAHLGERTARLSGRVGTTVFHNTDVQCAACGLVFTETLPEAQDLDGHYQDGFDNRSEVVDVPVDYDVGARLDLIRTHTSAGSSILEVGGGHGDFTRAMNEAGFQARGVDLLETADPDLIDTNVDISLVAPESFDAAVSYLVVEHVPDPVGWLTDIAGAVKPGGVVVIEAPHMIKDPVSSLYPEHLQHFAPHQLVIAMGKAGLEVIDPEGVDGSRSFAFAMVGRKPEEGASAAGIDGTDEALSQDMRDAYDRGTSLLEAMDTYAAEVANEISDLEAQAVYVWAINDYAERIAKACADIQIDGIVPVDSAKSKIGVVVSPFTKAVISPSETEHAPEGSVFVICSPTWFEDIKTQIQASNVRAPHIISGVPADFLA